MALLSNIPFVIQICGDHWKLLILVLSYSIIIGLRITPGFLIHNGFVMMKKEGRRLPHLLSLILGIIVFLGEAAIIWNIFAPFLMYSIEPVIPMYLSWIYVVCLLFGISVIYGSMSVLIFTIYIVLLQTIPRRKEFDYVIYVFPGLGDVYGIDNLSADKRIKSFVFPAKTGFLFSLTRLSDLC